MSHLCFSGSVSAGLESAQQRAAHMWHTDVVESSNELLCGKAAPFCFCLICQRCHHWCLLSACQPLLLIETE